MNLNMNPSPLRPLLFKSPSKSGPNIGLPRRPLPVAPRTSRSVFLNMNMNVNMNPLPLCFLGSLLFKLTPNVDRILASLL